MFCRVHTQLQLFFFFFSSLMITFFHIALSKKLNCCAGQIARQSVNQSGGVIFYQRTLKCLKSKQHDKSCHLKKQVKYVRIFKNHFHTQKTSNLKCNSSSLMRMVSTSLLDGKQFIINFYSSLYPPPQLAYLVSKQINTYQMSQLLRRPVKQYVHVHYRWEMNAQTFKMHMIQQQ